MSCRCRGLLCPVHRLKVPGLPESFYGSFRVVQSGSSSLSRSLKASINSWRLEPNQAQQVFYSALRVVLGTGPFRLSTTLRFRLSRRTTNPIWPGRLPYRRELFRRKPAAALAVIGYYRSRSGEHICLKPDDLNLIESVFVDPGNIFLIIDPSTSPSATAGFFFREGGVVFSGFSFMEFPFDPRMLASTGISATTRPPSFDEPIAEPPLRAFKRPAAGLRDAGAPSVVPLPAINAGHEFSLWRS